MALADALAAALSRALLDALRESSQARVRESLENLGRPQKLLNLTLILETYVQLITSWLGALAIIWATVVILGPFSTVLTRRDFWFTTTIVFIEATKIVGWGPKATFFLHLPGAIIQRGRLLRSRNPINIAGQFTVSAPLIIITSAPILQAASCVTLPINGLVSLARSDYYKFTFTEDPRIASVKPALMFFYALVLTEGALLLYLLLVAGDRSYCAEKLRSHYFGDDKQGKVFVNRYVAETLATCVQNGVLSTANRTLVIFATELLQSIDINDHVSAVSVLRTLTETLGPEARLVKEIYSSEELVGRLIKLVSPRSLLHQDTKLCIAEIFVKLGRNVRLADIPGAAMSVSSLIDASLIETAELENFDWTLFIRGFQILDELAANPENCIEMCSMKDVVSRIIAPVNHGLHMIIEHDPDAAKILKGSLRVVAKLTRGTGEACGNLRSQISGNNTVIKNILSILRQCTDQEMNIQAAEILARLNLGAIDMSLFQPNLQHLVTVINSDGSSNEYRAVAAELLAQICEKAPPNGFDLQPVSNSLSMVLKTTINIQNANPNDLHKKRCLASLLGLAVQICYKLRPVATAGNTFTQAVMAIPRENLVFVQTLVDIVQTSIGNEDGGVCLAVVKATAKLAIWMVERNAAAYLEDFKQVKILDKLEAAVQAMHHLDRYAILTRRGDENQGFETLRSVVRNATIVLPPAAAAPQEPEPAGQ